MSKGRLITGAVCAALLAWAGCGSAPKAADVDVDAPAYKEAPRTELDAAEWMRGASAEYKAALESLKRLTLMEVWVPFESYQSTLSALIETAPVESATYLTAQAEYETVSAADNRAEIKVKYDAFINAETAIRGAAPDEWPAYYKADAARALTQRRMRNALRAAETALASAISASERASAALTTAERAAEFASARFEREEPALIKAEADALNAKALKASALASAAPAEWAAYKEAIKVIADSGAEEAAQRAFYASERAVERAAPVEWAEYLTAIAAAEQAAERRQAAKARADEAAKRARIAQRSMGYESGRRTLAQRAKESASAILNAAKALDAARAEYVKAAAAYKEAYDALNAAAYE